MDFTEKETSKLINYPIACRSHDWLRQKLRLEEHFLLVTLSWFHTVCAKDMSNTCSLVVANCAITLQSDTTFIWQTRAASRDHNINTILT